MSVSNELTDAVMSLMDSFAVQREAAKGFRAQLITDGWSPESAEQIAKVLLMEMIQSAFHPMAGGES